MVITSLELLGKKVNHLRPSQIVLISSPRVLKRTNWALKKLRNFIGYYPEIIKVPDGEKAKDWKVLERVLSNFLRLDLDRKSLVLVLGGGSIGDLAGFACSIYLRGISYIQIPTTLLAQVDSAIGGKTAIDFKKYKNQIGSFYNPFAICIDKRFLRTLEKEQIIDGLAEIIKMGIIKDPKILSGLNKIRRRAFSNPIILQKIIYQAISAKQYFETKDPYDKNERQLLNFGHTVGHAIELKYKLSHGRAVLIGTLRELMIGEKLGKTNPSVRRYLQRALKDMNIAVREDIYKVEKQSILHDKKIKGDKIVLPIVTSLGKARLQEVPVKILLTLL